MTIQRLVMSFRRGSAQWAAAAICAACVVGLAAATTYTAFGQTTATKPASDFPTSADVESYRVAVEKVFTTDRGGTMPGYAACVMCHTWQTSVRFSLETPASDAGWTAEQSRRNFDVVTTPFGLCVDRSVSG